MKGTGSLAFFIGLLLIVVSSMLIMDCPENVSAVGIPVTSINLDQMKQNISVSAQSGGMLVFTGTVSVQAPLELDAQKIIVTLESDVEDWPVSQPPPLVFTDNVTVLPFTIDVNVPFGTSHDEVYNLNVGGTWRYEPGIIGGTLENATAIIIVDQYYSWEIGSDDPDQEEIRGYTVEYPITVTNTGNGRDQYLIRVDNLDDLEREDIMMILPDEETTVDMGQSTNPVLRVEVSRSTSLGTYIIEISVHSSQAIDMDKEYGSDTLTLFLEVVREKEEVEPIAEPEEEPEEPPAEEPGSEPEYEPEAEPGIPEETEDDLQNEEGTAQNDTEDEDQSSGSTYLVIFIIVILVIAAVAAAVYFLVRRSSLRSS